MLILFFNILIVSIAVISLRNFSIGYVLILCSKIFMPYMVYLNLIVFRLSVNDFFSIILMISFLINRKKIISGQRYPSILTKYYVIEILSTMFLILFSSGYVPYEYQILSYIKNILQNILFLWLGYWAVVRVDKKCFILIFLISVVAGVYGIISYIIKVNPYINTLYLMYSGSDIFNLTTQFLEETRAGLSGRTAGTMTHPLGWGQLWILLIGLYFLNKEKINRYLGILILNIGIINVILCGSRSSIVGLCLLFFFYVVSLGGIKKLFKVTTLFLALIFVSFITLHKNEKINSITKHLEASVFFWNQDISDKYDVSGSSVNMRARQLEVSMEKAACSLGGLGYGYQMYVFENSHKADDELLGLESIIFKKLVEQGYIGLLVYVYTMILLFKYTIKGEIRRKRILLSGFLISYIVTIMMTGIQCNTFIYFYVFILLSKLIKQENTIIVNK